MAQSLWSVWLVRRRPVHSPAFVARSVRYLHRERAGIVCVVRKDERKMEMMRFANNIIASHPHHKKCENINMKGSEQALLINTTTINFGIIAEGEPGPRSLASEVGQRLPDSADFGIRSQTLPKISGSSATLRVYTLARERATFAKVLHSTWPAYGRRVPSHSMHSHLALNTQSLHHHRHQRNGSSQSN